MGKLLTPRCTKASIAAVLAAASPLAAGSVSGQEAEAQPLQIAVNGALDGTGDAIDYLAGNVTVKVNGNNAVLNSDGSYSVSVPASPYYRIDIGGEDVFAMVQTFGSQETFSEQCNCLKIPAIELVKRKQGRIELFFGGDTMAGRRYIKPSRGERQLIAPETAGQDVDRLLAPMRPYIQTADLASVNLETVLANDQPAAAAPKRIVFYSPIALAGALKRAGVDYVTLGNNHINDYNDAGIRSTHDALEAAGLAHSGSGYFDKEAEAPLDVTIGGEKLAMLGFVGWQGKWTPNQAAGEDKGGAAYGTRGQIRRSVQAASKGGNIPVLQYHGGSEYSDRPGATTSSRLREAIDRGAPVAIGHHPHVVQGLEVHNGGLIAWSIGNFMFDQDFLETQSSFALKVWLEDGEFLRAEVVPIAVVDYRPVPAIGRMREAALRRVFSLSAELGTQFDMSGGHAVLSANGNREGTVSAPTAPCDTNAPTFKLGGFGPLCHAGKGVRVGRDVLRRGDFELAVIGDAKDRVWGVNNASLEFAGEAERGRYLRLTPVRPDRAVHLFTQTYVRDLTQTDYVMQIQIRAPQGARVEFMAKDRPPRGTRPTARWRGEVVGTVIAMPAPGWQKISVPFSRAANADGTVTDFRPVVRVQQLSGASGPLARIELDDFGLIELQPDIEPEQAAKPDWRWTHIFSVPGLSR